MHSQSQHYVLESLAQDVLTNVCMLLKVCYLSSQLGTQVTRESNVKTHSATPSVSMEESAIFFYQRYLQRAPLRIIYIMGKVQPMFAPQEAFINNPMRTGQRHQVHNKMFGK